MGDQKKSKKEIFHRMGRRYEEGKEKIKKEIEEGKKRIEREEANEKARNDYWKKGQSR